jgi:hypothetical protein
MMAVLAADACGLRIAVQRHTRSRPPHPERIGPFRLRHEKMQPLMARADTLLLQMRSQWLDTGVARATRPF